MSRENIDKSDTERELQQKLTDISSKTEYLFNAVDEKDSVIRNLKEECEVIFLELEASKKINKNHEEEIGQTSGLYTELEKNHLILEENYKKTINDLETLQQKSIKRKAK